MATMLYHRIYPPRVVSEDAVPGLLAEGWADTPAAFYVQVGPVGPEPETVLIVTEPMPTPPVPKRRGRPRKES